jgi:hypothetical protein
MLRWSGLRKIMNAIDSSIHGLFLGPVPIALGVWSFVEIARILSKKKKATQYSILWAYGLAPTIIALICFAMGVVARDDLSVRVLAIGSAISGVLAFTFQGMMWWRTDVPLPSSWFAEGKLPVNLLIKRIVIILFLLSCIFVPLTVFGLGKSECTTSSCRSAAILFGSNLRAGLVMWLVFAACGFLVSWFLASIFDLLRRAETRNEL